MYTEDKILTCADCGQEFTFTASEQQFYADRGFSDPRRCRNCRAARKSQMSSGDSMGGGGGYSSGGGYDQHALSVHRRAAVNHRKGGPSFIVWEWEHACICKGWSL